MHVRVGWFVAFVVAAVTASGAVGAAPGSGATPLAPSPVKPTVQPTVQSPSGPSPLNVGPLPGFVVQLSTNLSPPHTRASSIPAIAADGDDVYVLLASLPDDWGPTFPLYVAHSANGGGSYGTPVQITSAHSFDTRRGLVAASGGVVVVTWSVDRTLYYAMSTNRGASFSAPMRIADGIAEDGDLSPIHDLAFSAGGPVVAWQRGAPGFAAVDATARVFFARLTPSGPAAQVQLGREPFATTRPKIGTDGSRVVVAWSEDQNPLYLPSIAQSADDGRTWDRLANAAEGNPNIQPLSDAEKAFLQGKFPTGGTSKPIWRSQAANIERVFVFGATTIVTVGGQGSDPMTRAIVAAGPAGLFHGQAAVLQRCAGADVPEPQPLAQRDQPVLDQYERTPLLFARTSGGVAAAWAQGYKSTVQFRSRLFVGRFDSGTALTGCNMVGENVDFRPTNLDASGASTVIAGGTGSDALFGVLAPGATSVSLRHASVVPAGLAIASTSRAVAFAFLDKVATDRTGNPRSLSLGR
jgi:hypothetical protein